MRCCTEGKPRWRASRRCSRKPSDGRGGALILLGDAGVGKTTLLDAVSRGATNMRHLRTSGLEAESSLIHSRTELAALAAKGRLEPGVNAEPATGL